MRTATRSSLFSIALAIVALAMLATPAFSRAAVDPQQLVDVDARVTVEFSTYDVSQ